MMDDMVHKSVVVSCYKLSEEVIVYLINTKIVDYFLC
jgi:hypothetical protein